MNTKLTDKILNSPWKTNMGIYIFADTGAMGDEVVADDGQASAVSEALSDIKDIQRQLDSHDLESDDSPDFMEMSMKLSEAEEVLVNHYESILRLRGYGANLDQKRIMDHIIELHNDSLQDSVVRASKNLCDKLDTITGSSDWGAVWDNYGAHGGEYEGETFNLELERLKAALTYQQSKS